MTKDIFDVIQQLLPGFLAAWVFYGLTAHPKKEQFERVVEALIFSVIVQALNVGVRKLWLLRHDAKWTSDSTLVSSVILAIAVGLIFAYFANNNRIHQKLNDWGITKRTSFPSEWYSAFSRVRRYVILHLDGQRRLKGWPEEWPDSGEKGHFILMYPKWVLENGQDVPIVQTERMIVRASEVERVELMMNRDEIKLTDTEISEVQSPLLLLHKDKPDGIESTTAAPGE